MEEDLLRRRRNFAQRRSLSEYAVSLPSQPTSDGVHPKDDKFRFFKKGRDFQPRKAKHHFTEEELRVLETYESAAVLPSHTEVYKKWLETKTSRRGVESWVIISLVAIITGIIAFIMRFVCEKFQIFSIPFIQSAKEEGHILYLWMWSSLISCAFSGMSAIIIIYFCPFAAGSGLPEIIGILNGCVVRNVLSFRTLICKIVSVICTVVSRLPVGFEGPMIHIGAMVGAFMAKPIKLLFCADYSTSHCCSKICRYRDCQERYSLICVGAASGMASAFSSPISGLTFAMEEISSHWSRRQTWRTFVCCILARSTTELLRSLEASTGKYSFSILQLSESALFDMKRPLELSLLIFLPACVIGALGGLLGAIFIFMHLKASKFRRKIFALVEGQQILNVIKLGEVVFLAFLCSSVVAAILPLFSCRPVNQLLELTSSSLQHGRKSIVLHSFQCDVELVVSIEAPENQIRQQGEYHEGASLLFGSWEQMIRNLFSRKTAQFFSAPVLAACLGFFWFLSCWVSITSISCGLLIPQLAIGALYGRMMGEILCSCLGDLMSSNNSNWDWVDPGAFAMMGAASFLSGTSRLPITSVVMMVEMTNDINMCLLIMVCVMVSKFVGDLFTHSLYHAVLEFKCIPYLEADLTVYHEGKRISLELFSASHVMKSPVELVDVKESVQVLANLLLDTNHGAFPVVQQVEGLERTFLGIITRLELTILLTKTESFDAKEIDKEDMERIRISYPEYSSTKLKDTAAANLILNKYSSNIIYKNTYVNLQPYTNMSSPSIMENFSLRRTYMMFTAMGLRHLVVTDRLNQVVGIITRKDLMGYTVESRIKRALMRKNNLSQNTLISAVLIEEE